MKSVFYRISYYTDQNKPVSLFGIVQNSLLQTVSELQLGGVHYFTVELLTAEEFNECEDRPYTIPTE